MKLSFLGQTYFQSQKKIATIASENIGCYRSHQYSLQVPIANLRNQSVKSPRSVVVCKYRGVSYTIEHHQFPKKTNRTLVGCR